MPVQPPSSAELARIAASYGIELEGPEREQYTALADGLVASYLRRGGRPSWSSRPSSSSARANSSCAWVADRAADSRRPIQ